MIPAFVLHAGYCQIGLSYYAQHDQAVPPVPPLTMPLPSIPGLIEGPACMGSAAGKLSHKIAETVLSDGNPTVNQGHDIGMAIPHLAVPANALCAVHTAFSKHKVLFPISSVQAGGSPAGTYVLCFLGEICANPTSLPSGVVMLGKGTVLSSISAGDLVKGWLTFAADVALDLIWNRLKGLKSLQKVVKPAASSRFMCVLMDLSLWSASRECADVVGKYLAKEGANRLVQHVLKSWILSPLLTGLPWGKTGVGRGRFAVSWKFV